MAPEGFWRREISGDASLGTSGGGTISEGRTRPRGNVGMSSAWPCGNPPGGLQGIWDFPGTSQCCVWKSWREKRGVLHCHGARGGDGWGARDPSGIRIHQESGSNRMQNPAGIKIQQESGSRICNQGKALHGNGAAGIPSGAEPQLREGSPKDLGPSGPSTSLDLPGSLEVRRPWTWVILRVPSNPTIPYTRCQPGKAGFSRSRIPLFPG